MDNKEKDGYEYFLSVNTAVRSSRTLTSNCFFKLKGEEKDTGNRVLNDGCRKVSIDAMFFFFLLFLLFFKYCKSGYLCW